MKSLILSMSLISFVFLSCTSSYIINSSPEAVFFKTDDLSEGEIMLKTGKIVKGFKIQIAQDSISWVSIKAVNTIKELPHAVQKVNNKMHLSEIKKITFLNSKRGALAGFGSGVLIGTAAGVTLGLVRGAGDLTIILMIYYSGLISPITGTVGMLIGSNIEKEEFIVDKAIDSKPDKR